MKTVHGWAFPEADEFMAAELRPDGTYQADHLARALAHVTDWSLAIDGGAHVGTWARIMAAKFAQVIAVEPAPETFEALAANMTAFGCGNVDCRQVALGAVPAWVRLELDAKQVARKNTGGYYVAGGGAVSQVTIDSWQLPSLGFLKLDIEGSEPLALMGARGTLARCRPIVLYEDKQFWRRYGLVPEAVAQILLAAGYHQIERVGTDLIWGPR